MATYGDGPRKFHIGGDTIWANSREDALAAMRFVHGLRMEDMRRQAEEAGYGWTGDARVLEPAPPPPGPDYGGGDGGGGGGYDSGGGGGGGYAPLPPKILNESPEWLAFLNALGLEENQFRSDIDKQRSLAKANADYQIAGLETPYANQRRGIAGTQEARGMARSGETLKRLSESRAAQGKAQGDIQLGYANQLSTLESQLASKMMDLGARRAQQELQLRAQGYV